MMRRDIFKLPFVNSACVLFITAALSHVYASELPGRELTDRHILEARHRRENQNVEINEQSEENAAMEAAHIQLDAMMATWHASPLATQMAADDAIIPFGKGGVFIPRFTETNTEPDVEVFDMDGYRLGSWEPGRTIILDPGEYRIMLGSGAFRQRIVKDVTVEEGRTLPVVPDWSGLVIDVVDEQGIILKGEYELVRIDDFDPYGRGHGASIELGEVVRAWVLKPGIYKILGVGESYNTLTNFVTVRLLPGEFTNFLLIQDPEDFRIRGGGTIHLAPTTRLTSNWHFGLNIGVNVQFNMETDHQAEADIGEASSFTMGSLFDAWILYRKRPMEWSTRLRFEEGLNITDRNVEAMINTPDRLLMSSIYIWRVLNWFGPYARAEFNSKFFNTRIRRYKEDQFLIVNSDYYLDPAAVPDTAHTFAVEPAFSPLIIELGAGVSADMTTRQYVELRSRLGFGGAFSRYGDRYRVIENDRVMYHHLAGSDLHREQQNLVANSIVLYPEDRINIFEVGPQASIGALIRIGVYASAEGELKIFAPILPEHRLNKPDFELSGTLSWRLSRILNLDYTYRQTLRQPSELDVPVHTSTHGIWLRLHYSSR